MAFMSNFTSSGQNDVRVNLNEYCDLDVLSAHDWSSLCLRREKKINE